MSADRAVRVDWRTCLSLIGRVLAAMALPLVATAGVAVLYGEPTSPFLLSAGLSLVVGLAFSRYEREDLGLREGYLMVALTWLVIAVVGALPFVLAGNGTLATPTNALFESTSGVTTTGATVIEDFDAHGRSIHLWRAVLQWMGGLGILVIAVALLSQLRVGGAQLMETESQTQDVTKLTPNIEATARLLGRVYAALTVLMVVSWLVLRLVGLAPNVTVYGAVVHAFTAVSTAGFSPQAGSLGAFSPTVQWVTIPFMFLGATNFVLLYYVSQGDPSRLVESDEFRFYLAVVLGLAALSTGFLFTSGQFGAVEPTVRHALFQVVSILTTTGYATVDFELWSPAAKHVLFLAMFSGGMAGSTTCSIKTLRWVVVLKAFRRDLFTEVHPDAIRPVRLSGRVVDEGVGRIEIIPVLVLLTPAYWRS